MKTPLISIWLLLFTGIIFAQEHDLNYFLEQAKINSPLIHKSVNDNKIAALDLQQINNILKKPEINFEASILFAPIISHDNHTNRFEWISSGANHYNGYDLASTDGGQYQGVVALTQPLLTRSMSQSFTDKSRITQQQNQNNIELTIHELEQLVNNQYLLCLRSKQQSEISKELVNELKVQLTIMQKLVENAIYKQTDLMLLQIEFQSYDIEYRTYIADYKSSLYDLNLICGISDTLLQDIQEVTLQLNPDQGSSSKFLTSYTLDSLSIQADQSIFELKYLPQLNFFANAGLNAIYQPTFDRLGFSTGLTFTWNIFDGNQRELQREKSTINMQTLAFEKQVFVTQHDQNKNKILNEIRSLQQRNNLIEKQLNQFNTLFGAYQQQLMQGDVSVMDLKNLLKEMAAKKQEKLLLKMERQALINAYNYWNY